MVVGAGNDIAGHSTMCGDLGGEEAEGGDGRGEKHIVWRRRLTVTERRF